MLFLSTILVTCSKCDFMRFYFNFVYLLAYTRLLIFEKVKLCYICKCINTFSRVRDEYIFEHAWHVVKKQIKYHTNQYNMTLGIQLSMVNLPQKAIHKYLYVHPLLFCRSSTILEIMFSSWYTLTDG